MSLINIPVILRVRLETVDQRTVFLTRVIHGLSGLTEYGLEFLVGYVAAANDQCNPLFS